MATIEKRGNSFRVVVSDGYDSNGNKILKRKSFKKPEELSDKQWEKELNKLALKFENEVASGIQTQDQNMTLREFTDFWFKEYAENNLEITTIDSYKAELNNKILPALGNIKLHKLQPVKILKFLNSLLKDGVRLDGNIGPYSNRIVEYQWQILSSILQQAVYWQILPENPCIRVKVPKNKVKSFSNEDIEYYDENQTLLLLDVIDNEIANFYHERDRYEKDTLAWLNLDQKNPTKYKVGIYLALFCGLRNGEILGLTWNDVDAVKKIIRINKSRARTNQYGLITKVPKNKSSIRTVSAPDVVFNVLEEYKHIQDKERLKMGDLWDNEWYEDYQWIMVQWDGKGMEYSTLSKWLKKIVNRYNEAIISDDDIIEKNKKDYILPVLSLHKLRHTSATLLIGENTDIRTVSARLGHSKTTTTMDIYAHSLKSKDEKASEAIGGLLDRKGRKLRIVK